MQPRQIELLAPARNLECGIEAIRHGADAVYAGAPLFSARHQAGVPLKDISKLVDYAHQFHAKVYVALNTLLFDSELPVAEQMIWDIYNAGADALIVQDMGITMLNLPPLPLHASTQTDNRNIQKIKFLHDCGFSRVILARELSLQEITEIARQVSIPLEVFVYGALCVSCSGQCYLSEAVARRSANRGCCAQLCRLPYNLEDSSGKILEKDKHLLSLKDLNLLPYLEDLMLAGVTSFKIEGRLKDLAYLKNSVACFRKRIDEILLQRNDFCRTSDGKSVYTFHPSLSKTFNRGFTAYRYAGQNHSDININTSKSIGEPLGKAIDIKSNSFAIETDVLLTNGDGLCFFDSNSQLTGIKVNTVSVGRIFPDTMPAALYEGALIYRNFDKQFLSLLKGNSARRSIDVQWKLCISEDGFELTASDETNISATQKIGLKLEAARNIDSRKLEATLEKTGNTIFKAAGISVFNQQSLYLPPAVLTEARRTILDQLLQKRTEAHRREECYWKQTDCPFPKTDLDYTANVVNNAATSFYRQHGATVTDKGYEISHRSRVPLMFCRHCIKYLIGACPKEDNHRRKDLKEPLFLVSGKWRLQLEFDCRQCEMRLTEV